ncbi:MAG: glycosyltransferase [Nitrososphaeria archaeon]
MNIFFLINSLSVGGAERVALNLAKILPVQKLFLLEKDVKYSSENLNLQFLSNHTKETSSILKTFYIPFYAKCLSKHLKKNDIVISFLERANYVNALASFWKGHKTIISVHMSQISGRRKFHPYHFLSRLFYPRSHLIVSVSEGIKKELIEYYRVNGEKIRVIYNPVEYEEILDKSKESIEPFLQPFIITMGRLTKQKGQWYLLRIFREIKKGFPKLKLLILGEGELKDYLIALSQDLGLKTYVWAGYKLKDSFDVYFLGFQKNPFKFISKAEIFVLPSLWEGFSNALVEALTCGIPIISSDCRTGSREILAPTTDFQYQTSKPEFAEYGVLMPPFEPKFKRATDPLTEKEKIWVKTLKKLLENDSLRKGYSEKAKERARDFSIEKIIPQWKKILEEV